MRKATHSVILLLVGGALLKISIDGTYVRYVKEGMLPLLYVAGGVLVTVAVLSLVAVYRGKREESHEHEHSFDAAWLLLLPLLAVLLVAPPALGGFSAARSGSALGTAPEKAEFPPLPAGDPVRLSVLDYASRSVFDSGKTLGDRRLKLSGFLMTAPDGGLYLARMRITCCAADGRPVKVGLTGQVPGGLKADQWVEVTGKYSTRSGKDQINDETIPYFQVETLTQIAAPKKPYES
ncbi:TIGR03943 family putative permease subunit [Longispora albida]|uniref:TIGR03943 family putative permease subunit n=1 Tax=Longispora albida TaxID=203523 RepID=UPI0005901FAB|nr:TIGR03943 family protein [Longispora albida]